MERILFHTHWGNLKCSFTLSESVYTAAQKGSSFTQALGESKGWFTVSERAPVLPYGRGPLFHTHTGESKGWFTLSE